MGETRVPIKCTGIGDTLRFYLPSQLVPFLFFQVADTHVLSGKGKLAQRCLAFDNRFVSFSLLKNCLVPFCIQTKSAGGEPFNEPRIFWLQFLQDLWSFFIRNSWDFGQVVSPSDILNWVLNSSAEA